MLRLFLVLLLGSLDGMVSARAQVPNGDPPNGAPLSGASQAVIQTFDGAGALTTPPFTVQNKWEVRWHSRVPLGISVCTADHNTVAGTMGMGSGSFFLTAGGTYYLQIEGPKPAGAPASPLLPNFPPGDNSRPNSNSPDQMFKWNVQVVAVGSSDQKSTAAAPGLLAAAAPAVSPINNAPAPAASGPQLTEAQTRAVVLIKGDSAQGTGFLVKTPDGPAVVTNIHVIANNPNFKVTANSGAQINILSAKGAVDRDLVLLMIQDAGYSYLDLSTDISQSVQSGDEVITPGNSQGGEVMLNTPGKILGIGPDRVEFDNPIYHGNSGGPVFHTKTGKVVGVVTEGMKNEMTNDLDKASFASRNSAITGSMRYFGLRLDTVPNWVPIDWRRFQYETDFLDKFNLQSRSLDSYLNRTDPPHGSTASTDNDTNLYMNDEKIMRARAHFLDAASDGAHRIQALKDFISDLNDVADTDMDYIQDMNNFHPFDREQAQNAIAYRKALKDELDAIAKNVSRLDRLP